MPCQIGCIVSRGCSTRGLLSRARTLSMPEPMLATEGAVDERLREMNETFLSSLRGLGERRRAREVNYPVPVGALPNNVLQVALPPKNGNAVCLWMVLG